MCHFSMIHAYCHVMVYNIVYMQALLPYDILSIQDMKISGLDIVVV